MLMNNLLIFLS